MFNLTNKNYKKFNPKLLMYVRKECHNRGIDKLYAQDIVHEALIGFENHFAQGKPLNSGCKLMTLAIGYARNNILTWIHKYKVGKTEAWGNRNYDDKLWYDDESKEDRHGEHIYALNVLLSQLKPQERLVIELFYLDGLKDKEVIAQKLTNYGSEVVLRMMRKRAMQKLKNMASSMEKMG